MVPKKTFEDKKFKCAKPLTVAYNSYQGRCGDGCCGGLDSGEQDNDFEVGEVYEMELTVTRGWTSALFRRDDGDVVYLDDEQLEEHFVEVAEEAR